MNQPKATAPAETVPRVVPAAEYDHAERFIARVRQAATDPAYRFALYQAYQEIGWGELIPGLRRAVDEYQRFAQDAGELVSA